MTIDNILKKTAINRRFDKTKQHHLSKWLRIYKRLKN